MSRVQSIERAFAVLGTLANGPIGVTQVAERADLPKSTAARMLASLVREVVAALHVHGPSYRVPTPGTEREIAELVVATAARIAASLRHAG